MAATPSSMAVPLFLLLAMSIAPQASAADTPADSFLSPLFSPIIGDVCKAAQCGRGSCVASSEQPFGFECRCNPGWRQMHYGDTFQFLPCIIPNCTFDYSCLNSSSTASPTSPPPARGFNIFEPCLWAFCGGGSCMEAGLGYECQCREGFSNLLNTSTLPCYRSCSLGADCRNLGILIGGNSASSPPTASPSSMTDTSSSSSGLGIVIRNVLHLQCKRNTSLINTMPKLMQDPSHTGACFTCCWWLCLHRRR